MITRYLGRTFYHQLPADIAGFVYLRQVVMLHKPKTTIQRLAIGSEMRTVGGVIAYGLLFLFLALPVAGQDSSVPVLRDGIVVKGDLDGGEHFLAAELKQGQTLHLIFSEPRSFLFGIHYFYNKQIGVLRFWLGSVI